MTRKSLNNVNVTEPSNHEVKKDLARLAKINQNNSTFLNKKKNVVLGIMASTMVAVPVAVGITQIEKTLSTYKFEGKSFSSVDSAFDYVKKNSEVSEYTYEGMNSKWAVSINGVKRTFDSPEALREFLFSNQIQTETYNTSLNLEDYIDKSTGILGLDDSLWASMNSGKNTVAAKETVYEKSNGGFTTNADEASKSYFRAQDAFYFNNMYFNSKETLRSYLISNYLPNNVESFNSIVIQAPNGAKSNPISLADTSSIGAIVNIENFINANIEKVVTYTNSKTNEKTNINSTNLNEAISKVNVEDLDYQHIQSNQGESRYIIDNSIEDQHNLIGPYFYKGNLDVASFSNKNMWKKVNGVSKQVYQESVIDNLIGNFFTSVINDDNQLNKAETENGETKPHIFRTLLKVSGTEESLDEWFLDQIKSYNSSLYTEVINALNSLSNGKKFNTFYKIPVMYSFIMQRLINMNATNDIISLTIDYFTQVANFVQDAIEIVFLDSGLLTRSKDSKKFNVKEFFGIGNKEFDLNTSTEYFLSEIKTYDNLIPAMSAYVGAINNINTVGGILTYSGYDQQYLFDYNIVEKEQYYRNYDKYAAIYNTFSKINYDQLITSYVNNSANTEIKNVSSLLNDPVKRDEALNKIKTTNGYEFIEIFKGIGAKNSYLYLISEAGLKEEIEQYLSDGKWDTSGMLVQLGEVRAKALVELYSQTKNTDFSIYQAYLYALIDVRNGTGVFSTHNSLANKQLYDRNVVRLTALSFASVGGALYTIQKLHDVRHTLSGMFNGVFNANIRYKVRGLFDTIQDSIKNRWTAVKHSIPFITRSWTFNTPASFKWSSFDFMKTLGNVKDIFSAAAPVFGIAMVAFEIFVIVFDLLQVTSTQDFYVYTTADGTEFIWDGGLTTSRFFGLEVTQQTGINSMKLVEPVQITKPQINEFYYYNQVKYFDVNQLKKDQILTIISNENIKLNQNFSRKFTFDKLTDSSTETTHDTKQKVVEAVLQNMGITKIKNDYNFSNIKKDSKYIANVSYVLGNGIGSSTNSQNDVIANNIISNIRPTKVAQLPKIENGKIVGKNTNNFVLPGKVWTSSGVIDNSEKASEYITDNSANELNTSNSNLPIDGNISSDIFKIKDISAATQASTKALYEVFKTKAQPSSKIVLKSDTFLNNEYKKLNSEIQDKQIFKATLPDQGTVYFINKAQAQNWVLKNVNFEKYTDVIKDASYVYNGKYFSSTFELKNWLQSVIVME